MRDLDKTQKVSTNRCEKTQRKILIKNINKNSKTFEKYFGSH